MQSSGYLVTATPAATRLNDDAGGVMDRVVAQLLAEIDGAQVRSA
jgi:hypothetical protein